MPAPRSFNAKQLLLGCSRFDLIVKYCYLANEERYGTQTKFFENLYLEHIRAFNNFYEEMPRKVTGEDFVAHFRDNLYRIRNEGFDPSVSCISVDNNLQLTDGAHRLSICAFLDKDIAAIVDPVNENYDYAFFQRNGIDSNTADYAALEYVKLCPEPYIVSIHSVVPGSFDTAIEEILKRYGLVFYKKEAELTFNGYVNLKIVSYGSDAGGRSWLGNIWNDFHGAKEHARKSMGNDPFRCYVFICKSLELVVAAKREIRELIGIGNYSVHINDSKPEALALAQALFNTNSLEFLNARPYDLSTSSLDARVEKLRLLCELNHIDTDSVCVAGSGAMGALGLRESQDLDFLHCQDNSPDTGDVNIASHESELRYYPLSKVELIQNPNYYFYYGGLKFITIDVLYAMKIKRAEIPKDIADLKIIDDFRVSVPPFAVRRKRQSWADRIKKQVYRTEDWLYRKKKWIQSIFR